MHRLVRAETRRRRELWVVERENARNRRGQNWPAGSQSREESRLARGRVRFCPQNHRYGLDSGRELATALPPHWPSEPKLPVCLPPGGPRSCVVVPATF